MTQQQRSNLVLGFVLILLGGYFLAVQFIPGLENWIGARFEWPMLIIGFGLLLLILGVLANAPGFAIPAAVVSGIGGILYWQNATGDWASWSYIWALIPGFVGVGTIILGISSSQERRGIREGLRLIVISLILFAIFGSFFGAFKGEIVRYWPVLLILYGVYLLFGMITRRVELVDSSEPAPAPPSQQEEAS